MRGVGVWVCGAIVACVLGGTVGEVEARGGLFGGRSLDPGIGSNPRSYGVRPYVRQDGSYVPPYRRSTPNREWRDNWSTKPNVNPYTGKGGSRVQPLR